MSKRIQEFRIAVSNRLQDLGSRIEQNALDECIAEAVAGRYTQARPLKKIADIAGDSATFEWELNDTNFPGWVDESSVILALEYPAGERVPVSLDSAEWGIVRTSTAAKLRLFATTPATGSTLRVTYSVPHSTDGGAGGASTVPDRDFYAVANLAAALACRRLQANYNQLLNSALGADHADYQSKSDQYARLARDLDKEFRTAMGLEPTSSQPAASGWVSIPADGADNLGPLTH